MKLCSKKKAKLIEENRKLRKRVKRLVVERNRERKLADKMASKTWIVIAVSHSSTVLRWTGTKTDMRRFYESIDTERAFFKDGVLDLVLARVVERRGRTEVET